MAKSRTPVRKRGRWKKLAARAVRQFPQCQHCGSREDLTADHWNELHADGDPYDPENIVVLARSCNSKKHAGSLPPPLRWIAPPLPVAHEWLLRRRAEQKMKDNERPGGTTG
jgi:hypothetical protein